MQRRHFLCCGLVVLMSAAHLVEDCLIPEVSCLKIGRKTNTVVRWDKDHLKYYMRGRDTEEIDFFSWDEQFSLAFKDWSSLIPMTFEQVFDEHKADLIFDSYAAKKLGKKGGTLAWAEMPTSKKFNGMLQSVFDPAEKWGLTRGSGTILRAVACHEIGHMLGLHHSEDNASIMYPTVGQVIKPTLDDITKIQNLYGKRV